MLPSINFIITIVASIIGTSGVSGGIIVIIAGIDITSAQGCDVTMMLVGISSTVRY